MQYTDLWVNPSETERKVTARVTVELNMQNARVEEQRRNVVQLQADLEKARDSVVKETTDK